MRALVCALLGVFALFVVPSEYKCAEVPQVSAYGVVEGLQYGEWVPLYDVTLYPGEEDKASVGEIDLSLLDHADYNLRIRVWYTSRTDYFNRYNTYTIRDYIEMGYGYDHLRDTQYKLNVYVTDLHDHYFLWQQYGDVSSYVGTYPEYLVEVSPNRESESLVIELMVNAHALWGDIGRDQSYLMLGSPVITYERFVPTYPNLNLPDVSTDGLVDVSPYLPNGQILVVIGSVLNHPYVLIPMCIIATLGVVGFVLFGKKGD